MANIKSKTKIWILWGIAFVIMVAVLTFTLSHDLSGSYQTNEFFFITRITFFKDGKVTAQNVISDDLTETYQGTYRKRLDGTYLIEFTDGTSSSQNPVLKAEASHAAKQCNLAVKKIDEQTIEIEVIPEGELYAWFGKTAYFYWIGSGDDRSSGFLSGISKGNGLRETWDKYVDSIGELTAYYVQTDYDGDGTDEAFAITGYFRDNGCHDVKIYFISPTDGVSCMRNSFSNNGEVFGNLRYLKGGLEKSYIAPSVDYKADDFLLQAGNSKFLVWEIDGGGSSSISLILGVRDGKAYEPDISGKYMWFWYYNNNFVATEVDRSGMGTQYIDCSFTYDDASGQFILIRPESDEITDNPITIDDSDFVAPYRELINDMDTYEVLLDFTLDQVIDHGSFYEITDQVLNYAIGDGDGGAIYTPIYEGSVYVSKKAMSNRTLTQIEQEIETEKASQNDNIHYKWMLGSYLENPMTSQGFFNYFDTKWPSF